MGHENQFVQGHHLRRTAQAMKSCGPSAWNFANDPTFHDRLKIDPIFRTSVPNGCDGLFDPQTGSAVAAEAWKKHRILAQMISCTTYATGRNAFNNILNDDPNTLEDENHQFDMEATMKTDPAEWPLTTEHDPEENKPRAWLHCDIREKAFIHNWNAFQKFVELGNLK